MGQSRRRWRLVDPPDVMDPVRVPGKRIRNDRRSDLGVCESARSEVAGAIRDADLRRGALGHWGA